jgi:hypothetical protein
MIIVSTDLSAKFGPVRTQGSRPSCLAFASSDLNRFLNQHNEELSVEYLLHHAAKVMPGWTATSGLTVEAVLKALAQPGQPEEILYGYQPSKPEFPLTCPPALTPLFTSICPSVALTADAIAQKISTGFPVCIGVRMTYEFFQPVDGIVADSINCPAAIGHAILAVGLGVHNTNGMKYFLVRNSWGPAWGKNGYAWLSQQYLTNHLIASFAP